MPVVHNQKIPDRLIDKYPTEESIDPVTAVTQLLQDAGHPEPLKWLTGLHPDATAQETPQQVKRFLVNRHWRPILGMLEGEDTTMARYCMMDEGPMYTWLLLFKESVVPLIVKHQLPNINW